MFCSPSLQVIVKFAASFLHVSVKGGHDKIVEDFTPAIPTIFGGNTTEVELLDEVCGRRFHDVTSTYCFNVTTRRRGEGGQSRRCIPPLAEDLAQQYR